MDVKVQVWDIRFLSTGADGGHIYLRGTGLYESHGVVDVYVHSNDKELETRFRDSYHGGVYEFSASRFDFLKEIGLSLWNCHSWQYMTVKASR